MALTPIYRGPAQVTYEGGGFETAGEIKIDMEMETFGVSTDSFGEVDTRLKSRKFMIDFQPSGRWGAEGQAGILAAAERRSGASLMGGPLVIKPYITPQSILTFDRAGITRLPTIQLSATRTLWGSMQFTALEAEGANTGVLAALSAFSAPTGTFTPADIMTLPWQGDFLNLAGTQGLTGIDTEDGWTVSMEIDANEQRVDRGGIVDIYQTDFRVEVKGRPIGITETALLAELQRSATNEGLVPGESLRNKIVATGATLDPRSLRLYTSAGHEIVIQDCVLKKAGLNYGNKTSRMGEVVFVGVRKFTAGSPSPMMTMDL